MALNGSARVATIAVLAIAIAGMTMLAGTRPSAIARQADGRPADAIDQRADELLAKASQALGGRAALAAVTSLILRRDDGTTERFLFPDRWQSTMTTPLGTAIVTLDGNRHWSRRPPLPGGLQPPAARPADASRVHRDHVRTVVNASLKYLLHPPSNYPMDRRYAGRVTFGPVAGEAVEFTAPDGYWVSMIFNPSSGLPLAQVTRAGGTPEIHGTHLIEQFDAYAQSGSILVPFRMALCRLRLGNTEALGVWRFKVEVNAPLKVSDFREPAAAWPSAHGGWTLLPSSPGRPPS